VLETTFNSEICFTPGEQIIKNGLEATSKMSDISRLMISSKSVIRCLFIFPTIKYYMASYGVNEQNVTLVVWAAALSAGITRKFSTR
jgi:hypothetical protein